MGKIDLVAKSQTRGYRIATIILVGVGLILVGVGYILQMDVTKAVSPNILTVSMSTLRADGKDFAAQITYDTRLQVNTGTGNKVLNVPIEFTLEGDAKKFLEPIPSSHRPGLFWLRVKDGATDGMTGTVVVHCGTMTDKKIKITYVAPKETAFA